MGWLSIQLIEARQLSCQKWKKGQKVHDCSIVEGANSCMQRSLHFRRAKKGILFCHWTQWQFPSFLAMRLRAQISPSYPSTFIYIKKKILSTLCRHLLSEKALNPKRMTWQASNEWMACIRSTTSVQVRKEEQVQMQRC